MLFYQTMLLSTAVLLQLVGAFPLLTTTLRRSHIRAQHHHKHQHRHHGHAVRSAAALPLAAEEAASSGTSSGNDDDADAELAEPMSKQDQQQQQQNDGPQVIGMRVLNTHAAGGYWNWMESESHSVYVFAFTYFGMVTLMLVSLLILVTCCYMYDCMGCYEPVKKSNPYLFYGGGSNTKIFPHSATQTSSLCAAEVHHVLPKRCSSSSSCRRWSSPAVDV